MPAKRKRDPTPEPVGVEPAHKPRSSVVVQGSWAPLGVLTEQQKAFAAAFAFPQYILLPPTEAPLMQKSELPKPKAEQPSSDRDSSQGTTLSGNTYHHPVPGAAALPKAHTVPMVSGPGGDAPSMSQTGGRRPRKQSRPVSCA